MAYTEAQLKEAARKAYAAGDMAAAKRLIDAARKAASAVPVDQGQAMRDRIAAAKAGTLQMQPGSAEAAAAANEQATAMMQPERTIGQTIYENVIGSGAVDTPGERLGELIRGAGAGFQRGSAQLAGLPGTIGDLLNTGAVRATNALLGTELQTTQEATGAPGLLSGQSIQDALAAATGGASEFRAPGVAGDYAATIGEFLPGALGGPSTMLRYALAPAVASETAGQATEGSVFEPAARIAGAFFAPLALAGANKTVNTFFKRASDRPSLDTLRDAKNAAYSAVDASGLKAPLTAADDLFTRSQAAAAAANYVPDVDKQTMAALEMMKNQIGKELTIGELDKLRQGLFNRLKSAPNEVAIRDMIDIVDDTIQSLPGGGDLMATARIANTRYKKAELFENAFKKAEDQAASTGSGGNVLNKFRQAVTSIINNPKQNRFFTREELDFMTKFVRGDLPENTLRLIGKLSPSGNGLMMALNVGAIATNPLMAVITAGAQAAKSSADIMAMGGADAIQTMAATGRVPVAQPSTLPQMSRILPGLLAQ
jgi:hypothetical protein